MDAERTDAETETGAVHRCPAHNVVMVERDMRGATYEQKFCGTWFDCPHPGCTCSACEHSPELAAQLDEQRAKRAAWLAAPKFHIMVKPEGARTSSYLSSNGGIIRLKVHAAMYERERAEQVVREIQAEHGAKYALTIVPVK